MAENSMTNDTVESVLADRLGLDFILNLGATHPDFKKFRVTKKRAMNYVMNINLDWLQDRESDFRYLEGEVTNANKDFTADKGLFLYIVAKCPVRQARTGFIELSNVVFCTILSGIATIRAKSKKGSHYKAENVAKKQDESRNTSVIWHFNERIDKVYDCLSKYFLIKQDKETRSWTLENPIIGDCVQHYDAKNLSQVLHKLTPATKPKAKVTEPTSTSVKNEQAQIKSDEAASPELPEESSTASHYVDMEGIEYPSEASETVGYPHLHPIQPTPVQQSIPMVPYPHTHPPYEQYLIPRPTQSNDHHVPMSKIERDTGVPDYIWKLIESKARNDPHILIRMIDTLVPMRDQIMAMEQQGKDPRTLFVRSTEFNQPK